MELGEVEFFYTIVMLMTKFLFLGPTSNLIQFILILSEVLNKKKLTDGYKWNIEIHIYEFLEKNYPSYFAVGVRPLSEVDLGDIDKFYHNNKYNLIYDGLNVKFIKAFLGKIKTKENGNLC